MQSNIPVDQLVAHVLRYGFQDIAQALRDALDEEVGLDTRQRDLLSKLANVLHAAGEEEVKPKGIMNPFGGPEMDEFIRQMQAAEDGMMEEPIRFDPEGKSGIGLAEAIDIAGEVIDGSGGDVGGGTTDPTDSEGVDESVGEVGEVGKEG